MVFPPTVDSTSLRPDVVIWSEFSREVVLLELTVCAEEGVAAAQVRKEARYTVLMADIEAEKKWKATLLTLEIGARGLVASRTYRAFVNLGFSGPQANKLCKSLSTVAARCSYAIYLAHNDVVWRRSELLAPAKDDPPVVESAPAAKPVAKPVKLEPSVPSEPNISVLRRNGINTLFHFTDAANLTSIRANGLLSAASITASAISSVMNSDQLSRKLDERKGLANFVRLSLNDKNPMQFVVAKEKRVTNLVMLQVKLQVVSRPGVVFSDCNSARRCSALG